MRTVNQKREAKRARRKARAYSRFEQWLRETDAGRALDESMRQLVDEYCRARNLGGVVE